MFIVNQSFKNRNPVKGWHVNLDEIMRLAIISHVTPAGVWHFFILFFSINVALLAEFFKLIPARATIAP